MTFTQNLEVSLYLQWIWDHLNERFAGWQRPGCDTVPIWILNPYPAYVCLHARHGRRNLNISMETELEWIMTTITQKARPQYSTHCNFSASRLLYLRFLWTGYEIIRDMITRWLIRWKFKCSEYQEKTVEKVNWSCVPLQTAYSQCRGFGWYHTATKQCSIQQDYTMTWLLEIEQENWSNCSTMIADCCRCLLLISCQLWWSSALHILTLERTNHGAAEASPAKATHCNFDMKLKGQRNQAEHFLVCRTHMMKITSICH